MLHGDSFNLNLSPFVHRSTPYGDGRIDERFISVSVELHRTLYAICLLDIVCAATPRVTPNPVARFVFAF
jgi:hypothetical protein